MAKPEWGEKHRCSACGKPFYDMKKSPIICPACGAENVPERLLKPRRPSSTTATETKKKVTKGKKDPDLVEEDEDVDEDLDDDLVDPDTVDLPDDDEEDDDLSGVVIAPKGDDES